MMISDPVMSATMDLVSGKHSGMVMSSRVRLARNIRGFSYPHWADEQALIRVRDMLRSAFDGIQGLDDAVSLDMEMLSDIDRDVLTEKRIISSELAARGKGGALVFSRDSRMAAMINEEDHLRLQVIVSGLGLEECWRRIDAIDSRLEERVPYAFDRKLGYLSACPSNLGTGLRASVMMSLCGLRMIGDMDGVVRGLNRLGIVVRGMLGEGTEAWGDMVQISNQASLGETEEAIVEKMSDAVREICDHERNARARLWESRRTLVLDQIGRARGILMNARLISSSEALDILSDLRLGLEFGLVKGLSAARISDLMFQIQPGHLQKVLGSRLDNESRDEARAGFLRSKLKNMSFLEVVDV